jgi:imidazole glycerol-phosphate synthase subunit HisH
MNSVIGVVNYGIAGNLHSIKKAVEMAGGKVLIINNPEQFNEVNKILLPGVGSFKDSMQELRNAKFINPLKKTNKPILGICLGMQILSTLGFEYGKTEGLNLIQAEVKPILVDAKVPHVGFNSIHVTNNNKLLDGIENEEFYFMHSYEVINYTDITSLTKYANHTFVSSIHKNNLYGVQFHPEKSREAGIRLFKNFIEL